MNPFINTATHRDALCRLPSAITAALTAAFALASWIAASCCTD